MFRVLGPLEVDGSAIAAGSQERLLALLLQRANSWVDADTVVDALWPEDPPPAARGNVKTYVHQLRQVLPRATDGSPRINSRSGGYRLNLQRTELDASVFEDLIRQAQAALEADNWMTAISRLTQALELWRGEPYGLLGHSLIQPEADRLRALRDEALDTYQLARTKQQAARSDGDPQDDEDEAEKTIVLRLGPPADVRRIEPNQEYEPWSQWKVEPSSRPRKGRRLAIVLTAVAVVTAAAAVAAVRFVPLANPVLGVAAPAGAQPPAGQPPAPSQPSTQPPAGALPGAAPRRPVPGLPPPGERKLLFGVGDGADSARQNALVRDTPTRMLTTWYRGQRDLSKLVAWKETVVRQAYADGFALHLVITATDGPAEIGTNHGQACGRRSVVKAEYLDDIVKLVDAFAGSAESPPLFVTVFDQAQTYACNQGGFQPDERTAAYYRTLKDQYLLVRELFHRAAPNALVSLGWGAGLARAADKADTGAGMSMLRSFEDVLASSDFTSVSVTEGGGDNAKDVTTMVGALGRYGPVMLSWYAPKGNTASVVDADLRALLDSERLAELTKAGLFAMSLAPDTLAASAPETASFVSEAIGSYGRQPK